MLEVKPAEDSGRFAWCDPGRLARLARPVKELAG
jgi:hypothetical protein